ncbi:flagellar filament capping protein FliD [Aeromonas caviae]|uniref:flagellar filament capping protein FliD n=1 Tax=Aeromonas TaxID=642 RepID=UPI001C212235|nr:MULTISPECIES: flagellar filament capping protein FliD [Aeromonas]MCR3936896.1 flagellar filament capping protein FliD [Aeromonas caviae]MCR3948524.1 flagellar filament capping protein FliD [Aeromonas caviae]MDX7716903.1 flagellar filament capping protein FliD [Aeromonas caviae]QWZ53064.1 flagellar filament capping protein FliD [Aeromonas sp. FDAARGOS 1402]WMX32766.1 flagellar filament capping protein FliD [Aeromonas caviae]
MATITSAGAGSGIDLESVISASLNARKAQLQQPITTKKTNAQITLSGVGQLKSAIASYVTTLKEMAKTDAFNKRAVNITQDKDDPILKVESKAGASNGQYNITVNKLATTSKFEGTFDSSTTSLATEDGILTFTAGDKKFNVEVKAGDSLQTIRKKINNNGDNFGLTANIINTADGKAKLVMDSGVSGTGKDLQITGSTAGMTSFASSLTKTQSASNAEITVDGSPLSSDTNTFDGTIMGLKVTVLRESDKDTDGNVKSNKVDVTTDKDGIKSMIKSFIDGYNTLVSKADALGKRNSIVAGQSQDDGGALAGDSVTRSVVNQMSSILISPSDNSNVFDTIFQLGIKMDNKGVLSLDSEKFDEALDKNFEQVVAIFGGEKGVAGQLATSLEDYSKTGGLLAQREDSLNSDLRTLAQKESDATAQLVKYEASLRARYGGLDTLLAKMNQSASYLSLINTSNSSS